MAKARGKPLKTVGASEGNQNAVNEEDNGSDTTLVYSKKDRSNPSLFRWFARLPSDA